MKKSISICSAIVIGAIVLVFCFYFSVTAPKFAGDFSIIDFKEEIENKNYKTDNNYGSINGFKSAANAGKAAIAERFDNSNGGVFKWMGCSVKYDADNDAYYVRTYRIAPFMVGGAYDVIISSDGTVLAVWGEE